MWTETIGDKKMKDTLDIMHDLGNDRQCLRMYGAIIQGDIRRYTNDGEEIGANKVLKDPSLVVDGFVRDVLPEHIRNVRADLGGVRVCSYENIKDLRSRIATLDVSYDGKPDKDHAEGFWRFKRYDVKRVGRSLVVGTEEKKADERPIFIPSPIERAREAEQDHQRAEELLEYNAATYLGTEEEVDELRKRLIAGFQEAREAQRSSPSLDDQISVPYLAKYGKNVLKVNRHRLDEFLQHFLPIDPDHLLKRK
tara:strand:- start:482 stop:1237 length:756 start_codon:yes stop_codon:yes gene_type:complete